MSETTSTYDGTYSDNWSAFIRDLGTLSPAQKRHVRAEATTAGTLSVILSGQRHHVRSYTASDVSKRIHRVESAAAEIARLTTRNPNAPRYRVDQAALHSLGGSHATMRTPEQRLTDRRAARAFWASTTTNQRLRARIAAEAHASHPMWRLANAAVEPTTAAELESWERLRDEVRQLAGVIVAPKRRMSVDPAGMSPERALQIAVDALDASHTTAVR